MKGQIQIKADVNNTNVRVALDNTIVSSSQSIYVIAFNFKDNTWANFPERTVVFLINNYRVEKLLSRENICEIPFAIMEEYGDLRIGIYSEVGNKRKCSTWSNIIPIEKGSRDKYLYDLEEEN